MRSANSSEGDTGTSNSIYSLSTSTGNLLYALIRRVKHLLAQGTYRQSTRSRRVDYESSSILAMAFLMLINIASYHAHASAFEYGNRMARRTVLLVHPNCSLTRRKVVERARWSCGALQFFCPLCNMGI